MQQQLSLKKNLTNLGLNKTSPRGTVTIDHLNKNLKLICKFYKLEKTLKLSEEDPGWQDLCLELLRDFVPGFREAAHGRNHRLVLAQMKRIALTYWLSVQRKLKAKMKNSVLPHSKLLVRDLSKEENLMLQQKTCKEYNISVHKLVSVIEDMSFYLSESTDFQNFCALQKAGSINEAKKFPDYILFNVYHELYRTFAY